MLRYLFKNPVQKFSLMASAAALLLLAPSFANAQEKAQTGSENPQIAGSKGPVAVSKNKATTPAVMPVYTNYKGVSIGMSADEVRQKLDHLKEKGKDQDFFVFSDNESAQVYYDPQGKVKAMSLNYVGKVDGAPDPKAVLGEDVEAKPDGGAYKLVRYPEAGYWVSYNRTAGDSPIVTITMQKIQ